MFSLLVAGCQVCQLALYVLKTAYEHSSSKSYHNLVDQPHSLLECSGHRVMLLLLTLQFHLATKHFNRHSFQNMRRLNNGCAIMVLPVSPAFHGLLSIGVGYPIDIKAFISKATAIISKNRDPKILFNSVVTDLLTSSPAKTSPVIGATIRKPDGSYLNVRATLTIIATGGFQGSSKLVSKHIGPGADSMFIRANPHSTGDGYAVAQQAGVGTSRGLSIFYGHLLPSPLQNRQVSPTEFIHLAQFQSSRSILVNSEGRRFCDETFGDEVNNQHLARQPGRVGYVILSEPVKQKYAVGAPSQRWES
jgi:hypothetical protein